MTLNCKSKIQDIKSRGNAQWRNYFPGWREVQRFRYLPCTKPFQPRSLALHVPPSALPEVSPEHVTRSDLCALPRVICKTRKINLYR